MNPKEPIEILVYHKSHLKDQQIGQTTIDQITDGLFTDQGCWYGLNCNSYQAGRIRVGMKWVSVEEQLEVSSDLGAFQITIIEAKNLRMADNKIGTSNPYCKIFVSEMTFRTDVISSTIHPRWDQTFYAPSPFGPPSQVLIELKHDKLIKENLNIGEVMINTSSINPNEPVDTWLPVMGKTGMIHVNMVYLPEFVASNLSKSVVAKCSKRSARKVKQIASHSGNELIRNITRITLYLADRVAKRIHQRGFEGLIKVALKSGIKLQWDLESHKSRQRLMHENINEDKDGCLSRVVSALTDKIIDMNIVMALRMHEMNIHGQVGTYAKCAVMVPTIASLGHLSLEQKVDSRSIIKILQSVSESELARIKQMMEDDTNALFLDLPEDSVFSQGTLRVTVKESDSEFYDTNIRKGGNWLHSGESSSQGGLILGTDPKKKKKNNSITSSKPGKPRNLFCEVELHDTSKRTSTTLGLRPVWNETLSFSSPIVPPKRIEIAIMDDNTSDLPPSAFQRSRWSSRAGQIVRMRVKTKDLYPTDGSSSYSCEKTIPFVGGELKVGLEYDLNAFTPHVDEKVPYSSLGFAKMLQFATKILVYSALQLRRQANFRRWRGH
eukprot:TRINITY_DN5098_c0_g1_i1.p1 TRINITY_DN5098_c0_g1~~TRINITY_DN5098_c0_g1_i1.p1  ORF type:complete len:608 (-),score=90.18 TRINITY_DN5098_c0_g1_i1:1200-3023(-)